MAYYMGLICSPGSFAINYGDLFFGPGSFVALDQLPSNMGIICGPI